ncbi:MAG: adenylate/guanylate cyclase domain-containing protein [Armatimonadetes bacterium]|nr:adenylate/guanylate cyclase domain-containing protein [Armatimonadota bacterium]
MSNKVTTTCFTDIENSTALTEAFGNEQFGHCVRDHLNIGLLLAERAGGVYVKNIGDSNMVSFEYLESAICFSVYVQQYYAEHCCSSHPAIRVRIGLFLGVVEPSNGDVFGSGVNQAARVERKAAPGQVLVNKDLYLAIAKVWGHRKAEKYFTSMGEHELMGISNPPKQELYLFHWDEYAQKTPSDTLAKLVHDQLDNGKVEISNLSVNDLANSQSVIWPVVPRSIVTAIHRGQAEIIRMLARLGWNVHLLIADCRSRDYGTEYCQTFCEKLTDYANLREFKIAKVDYSSELFQPNHKGYVKTQDLFRRISTHLTLDDMLVINNKSYDEVGQIKNPTTSTLDFLRPAITMASVLYIAEQNEGKCLVVAGCDERKQWNLAYSLSAETRSFLGVLMNPMLKGTNGTEYQFKQKDDQPIWNSCPEMVAAMNDSNLAWWIYHMHAYLPAFPAKEVDIAGLPVSPQDWASDTGFPSGLDKEALAACCWKILDPNLTGS